jgi:UDP-N-acetylglucosamine 1-carboxyvinyltransferase
LKQLLIRGGRQLIGETSISGAKNAAVAMLPAILLTDGECTLENIPDIEDVRIMRHMLEHIGVKFAKEDTTTVTACASEVHTHIASHPMMSRMRASYYFLGAMIGRCGRAEVVMPGGCAIGQRPIDQHIKGLTALGAKVTTEHGVIKAEAPNGLFGSEIFLDIASVGATVNLMLAAAKSRGVTTIFNCAKEPHVVDLANFLNCMGANVKGAGTDVIRVRGQQYLKGSNYSIIPDQIETGTLMIAAAATRGDVLITNAIPAHMEAVSNKLSEMGVVVEEGIDRIRVKADRRPKSAIVKTMPYPGFPTDLQQPITALLSIAEGTSVIHENIFEQRFNHIYEIRRMGADINIEGNVAVVRGVDKLTGANVKASDLRAAAALVVAGLMAEGETLISNVKYIDRGYDHLDEKLNSLGAEVLRLETPDQEDISY